MTEPQTPNELPAGIVATIGLAVAAFAAVGVTGDFLVRSVRSDPVITSLVIALAILVVGIPSARMLLPSQGANSASRRKAMATGIMVMLVLVSGGVVLGAWNIADREQPKLSLSTESASGVTTITAEASGAGLRTTDDMLVQVVGFDADLNWPAQRDLCERSRISDSPAGSGGTLLTWQRGGPDTKGNVAMSLVFQVDATKFGAICGFASLKAKNDSSPNPSSYRWVSSYLRVSPLPIDTSKTTKTDASPAAN